MGIDVGGDDRPLEVRRQPAHRPEHGLRGGLDHAVAEVRRCGRTCRPCAGAWRVASRCRSCGQGDERHSPPTHPELTPAIARARSRGPGAFPSRAVRPWLATRRGCAHHRGPRPQHGNRPMTITFEPADRLFETGDFRAAHAAYRALADAAPESVRAHLMAATSLLRMGEVEAAIRALDSVAGLAPDPPIVHYRLAVAQRARGTARARVRGPRPARSMPGSGPPRSSRPSRRSPTCAPIRAWSRRSSAPGTTPIHAPTTRTARLRLLDRVLARPHARWAGRRHQPDQLDPRRRRTAGAVDLPQRLRGHEPQPVRRRARLVGADLGRRPGRRRGVRGGGAGRGAMRFRAPATTASGA